MARAPCPTSWPLKQRERLRHGARVVGYVVGLVDVEEERVLAHELECEATSMFLDARLLRGALEVRRAEERY
jgi:hypothetical protein